MALTADQIAARMNVLGGSDMGCLMRGDIEAIHKLWRVKMGDEPAEDLSNNWAVRLGEATEKLNLEWFERNRYKLSRHGAVIRHAFISWAAVTLDAWCDELQCPVEAKHVGGHEPLDPVIIERYQPQCQWQCEVTGADEVALSVIMGTNQPVVEFIARDEAYAAEMVKRGTQFMECVRTRTRPVELPTVPAPIDTTTIYDMTSNNKWANYAGIWYELRDSATAHEEAIKILKSLVPDDAKKCFGHGIQITRSRIGRLSLREMRE